MLLIFVGSDDYLVNRALHYLKERLRGSDDPATLESNTTVLDGKNLSPGELMAHASAVPFLGENRLVVVENLLGSLSKERKSGERPAKGRKRQAEDDPLEAWRPIVPQLSEAIPASTTVLLIEPNVTKAENPALKLFAPAAKVQRFAAPQERDVPAIVADFARIRELNIDDAAVAALGQMLPADRYTIDLELEKLATYAAGEKITRAMVSDVVSSARDAKVWDFTDALFDGAEGNALASAQRMIAEGNHPQVLLATIVTQLRRLVVTKELDAEGSGVAGVQSAFGMKSDFPAKKLIERSRRLPLDSLRRAYGVMLDADLSVKRGEADDEVALQIAIHRVGGICAQSRSTASPGRRR